MLTTPTIAAGIDTEIESIGSIHSLAWGQRDRDLDKHISKGSAKQQKHARDQITKSAESPKVLTMAHEKLGAVMEREKLQNAHGVKVN